MLNMNILYAVPKQAGSHPALRPIILPPRFKNHKGKFQYIVHFTNWQIISSVGGIMFFLALKSEKDLQGPPLHCSVSASFFF